MNGVHEKGCFLLNWPVMPGLKPGAKNHLALRLGEEKHRGKKAIPHRASTEVSHKNNIMVCSVSSGQACLCHCVLAVRADLGMWAAEVQANFKTYFMFICVCAWERVPSMEAAALDMCLRVTTCVHACINV